MKYLVDTALCAGHGLCASEGDVYELDDEGYNAHTGQPVEVPAGQEDEARRGVAVCPESAIQVLE